MRLCNELPEIGTAERFALEVAKFVGPGKRYKNQEQAAEEIGVGRTIISVIIQWKRNKKTGYLLYSRKTAEKVTRELDLPLEMVPTELRPISIREEAKIIASPERVNFGKLINARRKELGWTIQDLHIESGLTYRQVANAISGVTCTPETAVVLCKVLGISYDLIPGDIKIITLNLVDITALITLGITSAEKLTFALKEAVVNKSYKDLAYSRRRRIELLEAQLAQERRKGMLLQQEISVLKGAGTTPDPEKSDKVSADPPPDG